MASFSELFSALMLEYMYNQWKEGLEGDISRPAFRKTLKRVLPAMLREGSAHPIMWRFV